MPIVDLIAVPQPHITILDRMRHFMDACDNWKTVGREDEYTVEDMAIHYPGLARIDACGFAVFGLPTQEWLTMESDIGTTTAAIERLRVLLESANRQLIEQYDIITKATEEIKETLGKEPEQ